VSGCHNCAVRRENAGSPNKPTIILGGLYVSDTVAM
jgi:hypothetical protein